MLDEVTQALNTLALCGWHGLRMTKLLHLLEGKINEHFKKIHQKLLFLFLQILRYVLVFPRVEVRSPTQIAGSDVDHATSGHCCWTGHRQILHFKQDSNVLIQLYSFAIYEAQSHVIIEDCIHIFNPESVNWAIKHAPILPARVCFLCKFSEDFACKTVGPLL